MVFCMDCVEAPYTWYNDDLVLIGMNLENAPTITKSLMVTPKTVFGLGSIEL